MFKTNDIIKLSALSIMEAHSTTELECVIVDVRTYEEPKGLFMYEAYICTPASDPNANPYMVLVKHVGSVSETFLLHLDKGVAARDAAPFVLTEDGKDVRAAFSSFVIDNKDVEHELAWQKTPAGTFFGVRYKDCDSSGHKTICELTTSSDYFRPRCFVDWAGDNINGWIEFWYGEPITDTEAAFSEAARPL